MEVNSVLSQGWKRADYLSLSGLCCDLLAQNIRENIDESIFNADIVAFLEAGDREEFVIVSMVFHSLTRCKDHT